MNLDHDARPAFSRFCHLNKLLWDQVFSQPSPSPHSGIILVDLFHDNPCYLLRSLLIAKYLQCHLGYEMVGLIGTPGVVAESCPYIDLEINKNLARSFGIITFWLAPDICDIDRKDATHLLETLPVSHPSDVSTIDVFRHHLKALTLADGFPIGRFIYDTTIRSELCATLKNVTPALKNWTAQAIGLTRWIQEHLSTSGVGQSLYFVTGHLDYNPWGLIAEKVCRMGGETFWFRPEHNVPVYHLTRDPHALHTLNAVYHAIEAEWFKTSIWPNHKNFSFGQRSYARGNALRAFYQRWTTRNCPDVPRIAANHAAYEWRLSYGWDEHTPIIGIFAHAFADQPLADEQLYDDRYVWLAETLAFAAKHPERHWLIKLHPVDLDYDRTGTSRRLMDAYAHLPHMRFARGETAFNVIQTLCDVGVTIFGLPGLQMAAAGKPVIAAGNGPYVGCGFVHRPETIEEYHRLLLADPSLLQPTVEQTERAQLYEYASALAGTPSSSFLEFASPQPDKAFWQGMTARLHHHNLLNDDLYMGLTMLLANRDGRIRHPFVERYYVHLPTQSRQDHVPSFSQEAPLSFSSDEPGKGCLIHGFRNSMELGAWTSDDNAFLLIPKPAGTTGDALIVLDYKSVPRPFGYKSLGLKIYVNGVLCCCTSSLKKRGTLFVSLPQSLKEQSCLVMRLSFENLVPLFELRPSMDQRCYGIALMSAHLSSSSDLEMRPHTGIFNALVHLGWRGAATLLYLWRAIVLFKQKVCERDAAIIQT